MCGRFTFFSKQELIKKIYQFYEEMGEGESPPTPEEWEEILRRATSFNIAPSQEALTLRMVKEGIRHEFFKWGLVPFWTKDLKKARKPINARAETVDTSGMFKHAFKKRRCLIPSDGFYEWKKLDAKTKQPYFIHLTNDEPMWFAGLYERWSDADDHALDTFTIITTTANDTLSPLHDRMPVILNENACREWLDPDRSADELKPLLTPCPDDEIALRPVSSMVNSPGNNRPECIEEIPLTDSLF